MAEFLKQYQVTIETIGPLFIGAGKQLRKNEYILEGKRLYPIDEVKLMALLKRYNLLDKFVKDYKTKLADWLKKESVNSEELANLGKYELDCRAVEKGTLERDIQLFMKDWQGKPYVPGSSLKGALRTVLLGSEVMQNRGAYGRLAQEVERKANKEGKGINRESKKLEEMVFGKVVGVKEERVIRDTLSGLRVSDSRPLEVTDLTLCQKIDVGVDGREEFVKLVRECIRPGTKIIFDLTIDTYQCDIDGEKIMEAVNLFLAQYNQAFLLKFPERKILTYEKDVIYLGGGSGYATKTVSYNLLDERRSADTVGKIIDGTLEGKMRARHKHKLDSKKYGVSPHMAKETKYDGCPGQMGACKIAIEQV